MEKTHVSKDSEGNITLIPLDKAYKARKKLVKHMLTTDEKAFVVGNRIANNPYSSDDLRFHKKLKDDYKRLDISFLTENRGGSYSRPHWVFQPLEDALAKAFNAQPKLYFVEDSRYAPYDLVSHASNWCYIRHYRLYTSTKDKTLLEQIENEFTAIKDFNKFYAVTVNLLEIDKENIKKLEKSVYVKSIVVEFNEVENKWECLSSFIKNYAKATSLTKLMLEELASELKNEKNESKA
jgi:hypothetical protein